MNKPIIEGVKNKVIKSDIIAGGFGTVRVNGEEKQISAIQTHEDNNFAFTLTLSPTQREQTKVEDAEFEIIEPKQIENKSSLK